MAGASKITGWPIIQFTNSVALAVLAPGKMAGKFIRRPAKPAGDCDSNNERGRMSIDTTNNRLYICNGATRGWDYVALTN